jgi:hypothetical protein
MLRLIKIMMIFILGLILFGCAGKNTTSSAINTPANPPTDTATGDIPTQQAYPYPLENIVPTVDSEYPGPVTGPVEAGTIDYQVTNLVIPTPSPENGVVTGQLLVGGEGGVPYIGTLYLAETLPPNKQGYPPIIAFSEQTDQLGSQDVETGKFLFTDVRPGQYAIIIWTPFGGNPLTDKKGDSLIFSVNAGEVTYLGVIPIQ